MKAVCIIPARYASSRLPGKPLARIGNKPMIQWVYEKATAARKVDSVIIATDDERILQAVTKFGGQAKMTDPALPSGTDRVAVVAAQTNAEVIINLQGDEPLVDPALIDALVDVFSNPEINMATPVRQITDPAELEDPNLVRVVRDKYGYALYFTRSIIPYMRDVKDHHEWQDNHRFFKHIGIYAYRASFLQLITRLPESALEKAERLEQLRALENGYRIFTIETDYTSLSVDTVEDLKKINDLISH
jgi:3-deoxy-manno-octulosonate cytidylyltransferase (CMP-KDO synthetase)